MKKLIMFFTVVLLFVFNCNVLAQTWTDDESANGKVTRVKSGTKSAQLVKAVADPEDPIRTLGAPQSAPVRDSMVSAQTKTYDFAYSTKAQVTIFNPSLTTADTVKIALWNVAKGDYSNNALSLVSLNYLDYGYNELDNTTIIIPANTSRKWTVAGYGVGLMKIEWKTTAGKTSSNKFYISYQKIN